jgi:hypothetical protein
MNGRAQLAPWERDSHQGLRRRLFHDQRRYPDTIAAVVRGEPDWSALPPDLPADIATILKRCLQKDRRQRFGDISVPLFLMNEPREAAALAAPPLAPPRPLWKRPLPPAATAIIVAAITGAVVWGLRPAAVPPLVTRFAIRLGEGQQFTNPGRQLLAISRDGSHVVYVANLRLYLRSMSDLEARPIPGTEAPEGGLLRRRMSRLTRSTVKFADSTFAVVSSPVCTLIAPKVNLPAFPFARLPTRKGMTRDSPARAASRGN